MSELAIIEDAPQTAIQIRQQVNLIQEVMALVMKDGEHYGCITGCGNKKTLFKSGAEKLMSTFRIAADPIVADLSTNEEIRYRVSVRGLSASGRLLGTGIGECSTNEDKYKWRAPKGAEWDNTPDDRRRTKYKDSGTEKQVRTNPIDLANTVLKMAKKRGLVDMVLTVTAASDIFTQDIEDMDDVPGATPATPPIKRPTAKTVKAEPVATPQKAQEPAQDSPQAIQGPSGEIMTADDAAILGNGEKATIGGVLSWDAEEKTTGNQGKPFYVFKLKAAAGQPVPFSHWGEMPGGLKKGVSIIFDCEFKETGGKLYRNASNLRIVE